VLGITHNRLLFCVWPELLLEATAASISHLTLPLNQSPWTKHDRSQRRPELLCIQLFLALLVLSVAAITAPAAAADRGLFYPHRIPLAAIIHLYGLGDKRATLF